jgi:hypothetical protein
MAYRKELGFLTLGDLALGIMILVCFGVKVNESGFIDD